MANWNNKRGGERQGKNAGGRNNGARDEGQQRNRKPGNFRGQRDGQGKGKVDRKQREVPATEGDDDSEFIFGRHAVQEALREGSAATINKLFVQSELKGDQIHDIVKTAQTKKIIVSQVPKSKLDLLSDRGNHQGVMLAMTPYAYASIDDLFANAAKANQEPFFLLLDNLEDPHNLGSILRTADAVGVHGIIIPKHRAVGLTSTVAKISTGAIEHVPVARVTNLAATIRQLKERGMWIFGTAMEGQDYRKWNAQGSVGLVIGNEGKGISPGVAKLMDATISIPMVGHVQSLNASVATGILLYQAFTSRESAE
ncbi:23S rRNA (guanosine(2251)-2'-O)-methyltransferase RlmB [Lacticaseibacillus sharpeae]|nr:23S rRNA (guanosine(2251)-2'-O)-methyltransferase RlmB [Lacticaseibacillus sharpeae]